MSFVVTASLVLAADRDGLLQYNYQGAVVDWLSEADAERFLVDGMVEKSDSAVPAPAAEDKRRPPQTATKDAWVQFAVSRGLDRAEAEELTKQDLIKAVG